MDDKFDDVVANIKACLNSSKNQISLASLNRDYREIIGSNIPYHKLGYKTLEDFIRAVPNLNLNRIGNDVFVDVKTDAKTAHIAKLVREQNAPKKKGKRKYGRPPPRRNYPSAPARSYPTSQTSNNFSQHSRSYPKRPQQDYGAHRQGDGAHRQGDGAYRQGDGAYRQRDGASRQNDTNYHHRYRDLEPCPYNFSDDENDDDDLYDMGDCEEYDDYDSPSSPENGVIDSSTKAEPIKETDFKNFHITVKNKQFERPNASLRGGLRMSSSSSRSYPYQNDAGYSSMSNGSSGNLAGKNWYSHARIESDNRNNSLVFDDWDDSVDVVTENNDWDDSVVGTSETNGGLLDNWDDSVDVVTENNDWDDSVVGTSETNGGHLDDDWDDTVPEFQSDSHARRYENGGSWRNTVDYKYSNNNNYERTSSGVQKCDSSSIYPDLHEHHNGFDGSIFHKNSNAKNDCTIASKGARPSQVKSHRESTANRMKRLLHEENVRVTINNGCGRGRVVHLV